MSTYSDIIWEGSYKEKEYLVFARTLSSSVGDKMQIAGLNKVECEEDTQRSSGEPGRGAQVEAGRGMPGEAAGKT